MPEVLLDSTTFMDLERAPRHMREAWAIHTVRHALKYRTERGNPLLSVVSVMEILRGLLRDPDSSKAARFLQSAPHDYRIVELSADVAILASRITFALESAGRTIGLTDTVIAATALHHDAVLVSSNTRHFRRVVEIGYPIRLADWRLEE